MSFKKHFAKSILVFYGLALFYPILLKSGDSLVNKEMIKNDKPTKVKSGPPNPPWGE